jgi:hypothetical protein
MKKIALLAMTAAAAIASPAMAQQVVTGNITLTGVVGPKCFVGTDTSATGFSDAVDFTQLDAADGTLRAGLASDFATRSFTVKCTSGNPTISVTALPLATAAAAPAGYDNSIDYSATVTVDKAGGGTAFVTDTSDTTPTATSGQVGAPLANSAANVRVTTSGYATGAATDLLVAGTYNGSIKVTISPTN